tara:strand:- start:17607 stop:17867 length:261 start_codon:yes stop_codon:yes gene_type:complete
MFNRAKYYSFLYLFMGLSFSAYSVDKRFDSELPNCNDNEKILKIINKTNGDNRIMCIEQNHELYSYLKNNKNNNIKIMVGENSIKR